MNCCFNTLTVSPNNKFNFVDNSLRLLSTTANTECFVGCFIVAYFSRILIVRNKD